MRILKIFTDIILAVSLLCGAATVFADEPAPSAKTAMAPAPKQPAEEAASSTSAPEAVPTPPASPDQQSPEGKEKGKNCIWTCLQWDKQCNVDPRGVYKCNRVCSQFGEQCE